MRRGLLWIRCLGTFNPFVPVLSVGAEANRDHRKITVIDGHTVLYRGYQSRG